MDGPCDKNCMWMVSDEEKTSLCLMKNSYKTMIKKVTKDISLECTKKLHKLYSNVLVLPKRMKIDKCEKVVCNLYNQQNYVINHRHIRLEADNGSWVKTKNVRMVIEFNQEAWLKSYIDMNTALRTKAKNCFQQDFFKVTNNSVFGKTIENVKILNL